MTELKKELKSYKGYRVFKTVEDNEVYYFFIEHDCNNCESEYFWSLKECHQAINEWIQQMAQ